MKSSSIKKILILVTILAVPGFLYYLLQEKGKNRYHTLQHFGPKEVSDTYHTVRGKNVYDTIYHQVRFPKLLTQFNDSVALDTVKNKVYIVSLFYIHGGYSAKVTKEAMDGLFNTYRKNKRIDFLSITVDPENDRPVILKAYEQKVRSVGRKWLFLTGDETNVYNLIRNNLLLDVINENNKITYSNMLVLLDHAHYIRGYYDATSKEAVAKLDDEVKVLMAEELRNIKDGR